MKTKLISFLLIFVSFPSIVHLESIASLASRIEIFRDRIWNHILVFKYNFNRIRLFYNFLTFIFYHFNHIIVKEHFYGLLRIHFVKSKYYSSIPYLFECIYIAYNVSSRVYVIVYFFWSIAYNLLEARNISYDISLPRNWICVQNMFRLVELSSVSPLHLVIRCAKWKRKVTLFVDSSWQLDVWNFLETSVLFIA